MRMRTTIRTIFSRAGFSSDGMIAMGFYIPFSVTKKGSSAHFLQHRLWWFLKDEWTKQRTQKAGGALDRIPLEDLDKSGEGADSSASKLVGRDFDRAFAVETITKAVQRATRSKSFLSYFVSEHAGKGVTQEAAGSWI
jgi:hypothetical protein